MRKIYRILIAFILVVSISGCKMQKFAPIEGIIFIDGVKYEASGIVLEKNLKASEKYLERYDLSLLGRVEKMSKDAAFDSGIHSDDFPFGTVLYGDETLEKVVALTGKGVLSELILSKMEENMESTNAVADSVDTIPAIRVVATDWKYVRANKTLQLFEQPKFGNAGMEAIAKGYLMEVAMKVEMVQEDETSDWYYVRVLKENGETHLGYVKAGEVSEFVELEYPFLPNEYVRLVDDAAYCYEDGVIRSFDAERDPILWLTYVGINMPLGKYQFEGHSGYVVFVDDFSGLVKYEGEIYRP